MNFEDSQHIKIKYVISCNTGPKCEETLDLCDNHVCQNNGRCDSQGSGVTCICPPGQ